MSTVIHKIDLVCRMLREAGNPEKFEGVHSTLMQAKGRIARLEAQLAATETMRDRAAMQILPGLMEQYGLDNADKCVRRSFQWADAFLAGRNAEPAAPAEAPREYKVGDKIALRRGTFTICDFYTDELGRRQYSWTTPGGGSEGDYSAAEIAEQLRRG